MKKINQAKSIVAKLSSLARAQRIPFERFATTFLLERLLVRLVSNPQLTKSLVFKGGYVGLRVYNSARYTVDLDALLLKADVGTTLKQTAKAIEADIDDGAWFVLESQLDLQTQGVYGGIRQIFRAGIGEQPKDIKKAQIINFDLGIGDPVTPGPVKTQTVEMIGGGELSWQVYPIETIVAEKLHALFARANDNSRSKDIYDLCYYLPKADAKTLKEAAKHCFAFRKTQMPIDPTEFLAEIDHSLLKRGWKNAITSLHNPPTFEEAFATIAEELARIFISENQKSRAKK